MYSVGRAINHTTTVEGPQKLKIEPPSGPAVLHLGTQPKDSVNMHDHCCFVTTARAWDQPSFTKTCLKKMHPTDIIEIYSAIKKNCDLCRKKMDKTNQHYDTTQANSQRQMPPVFSYMKTST